MTDQEFIQQMPTIDKYYVIYCAFTKMPYIECDIETYDDKIYIFLDEEKAKKCVENYKEDKMILNVRVINRSEIRGFFSTLFAIGVNMVSFQADNLHNLQLEQLVERKFPEGAPKPIENPTLQISMMYFMQAVRTAETQEEQMIARQYEEEMMVNIARAHYLVPTKELEQADEEGNQKVAFLQMKNANGESFIPLFTDINEFVKANPQDGTVRFMILGFNKIKTMKFPGLNGFIINPGSISVLLTEQHIQVVDQRFGQEAEEA